VGHRELCATSCPGDGFGNLTLEGIAKKVDNAIKHEKPPVIPIPVKDKHYTELVQKYATQYNLRVEFVHSIIKQESDYNPKAVSKSGAMGLMQILPSTWEDIVKKLCIENPDPFDPDQNIRAGTYYLDWVKKNADLEWCVACGYNQGIGHFKRGTMPVDGLKYANEVKKRIYSE
jgi:soluble lytic murein transglycosylase-like protein